MTNYYYQIKKQTLKYSEREYRLCANSSCITGIFNHDFIDRSRSMHLCEISRLNVMNVR